LTTGLPAQEAWEEFKEHLVAWEEAHPSECTLEASSTQFFGVKEVGTGLLEKYTQFVMVPAVRDASADGEDARGSVISQLIDMVVRNTLAENQQVCQIKAEVADKLGQIPHLISLDTLNSELNTTMQRFTPNTAIALSWKDIAFQFQDPQVDVQLEEDGYNSYIHRSGHGVQRAFIMTMLQHLATNSHAQKTSSAVPNTESDDSQPTVAIGDVPPTHLIFAIEEPELFQHPSRQRHFAHVLHELAHGKISGVASSTQVLYCTHSPLFVDIDQFENIRLIRKTNGPEQGEPQQTTVKMTRLQNITPMNHHKLSVMLTPAVNEGFFARRIIVVEGEGDKAYLQMVARYCFKESLEAHGIVVIAVGGNNNIEKPLIVFPEFGIPVYPVWDNDRDKEGQLDKDNKPKCTDARRINRRLLSLCGHNPEDWPEGIHNTHAIFSPKLEAIIEHDVTQAGINWPTLQNEVGNQIGGGGLKSHAIVSEIVKRACERGCQFPFASQIIERVMTLAGIPIQPTASGTTTTSISAASTGVHTQ